MKYRRIVYAANILIPLSFIIMALIFSFSLGWTSEVWLRAWQGPFLTVILLIVLDCYFIFNWKYFTYLESENWTEMRIYLRGKLDKQQNLSFSRLYVLINVYLYQKNYEEIIAIGKTLQKHSPRTYRRSIAIFGVVYMMLSDYVGLAKFLKDDVQTGKISKTPWGDWFWAFAMLQQKNIKEATRHIILIARLCKDDILRILSLYILVDMLELEDPSSESQKFLVEFRNKYSPASWAKYIEKQKGKLHILLLSGLIQDAGDWCMKHYKSAPPIASSSEANNEEEID